MSEWTDVSGASSTWTELTPLVLHIMAYEVMNMEESVTQRALMGTISVNDKFKVQDSKTMNSGIPINTSDKFKITESKTVSTT